MNRLLLLSPHIRTFEYKIKIDSNRIKLVSKMVQVSELTLHFVIYNPKSRKFKNIVGALPPFMSHSFLCEVLQSIKKIVYDLDQISENTVVLKYYTVETSFIEYTDRIIGTEIETALMEEHSYMFDPTCIRSYAHYLLSQYFREIVNIK